MMSAVKRRSATSLFSAASEWYSWMCCCFRTNKTIMHYYSQPENAIPSAISTTATRKSIFQPKRTQTTLLTSHQRLIVVRTWHMLAADIAGLGLSALTRLFDLDVETERLFRFRDDMEIGQEMQHHPRFRQHAFWLVQAVNAVVENLDHLDSTVEGMLVEIGEKHAAIPHFYVSFFAILPQMYENVWEDQLKERYSANVHKSWERIFNYIVEMLVGGFENAPQLQDYFADSETSTVYSTRRTTYDSFSDDGSAGSSGPDDVANYDDVGIRRGPSSPKPRGSGPRRFSQPRLTGQSQSSLRPGKPEPASSATGAGSIRSVRLQPSSASTSASTVTSTVASTVASTVRSKDSSPGMEPHRSSSI